jgi:ribosomal protection tetracycline resistance protein
MQALGHAGTVVCEPTARVTVEVPVDSVGAVLPAMARLGAAVETPVPLGELSTIEALLPTARVDELQRELPRLTRGEGVLESSFGGYQPISGAEASVRKGWSGLPRSTRAREPTA